MKFDFNPKAGEFDTKGIPMSAICANCGKTNGSHSVADHCPILDGDGEITSYSKVKFELAKEGIGMDEEIYQAFTNDAICWNCHHRKGDHGASEPHRCYFHGVVGKPCLCKFFYADASSALEAPSNSWYNQMKNPVWRPINPDAFRSHPMVFSRFANWLATEPKPETRQRVWRLVQNRMGELIEGRPAYNIIKPHELVIAKARAIDNKELWIYGAACADPQYPSMLSIRMTSSGLRYEVDGVWLFVPRGMALDGWSMRAICSELLPVSMVEDCLNKLKDSVTYIVGKEIWG